MTLVSRFGKWSTWAISVLAMLVTLLTVSNAFNVGSALANTPGAVDSTFKTNIGSFTGTANAVAVQSDGSILVTGSSSYRLNRFSASGVADTAFNTAMAANAAGATS
jgi:hypothetical protein